MSRIDDAASGGMDQPGVLGSFAQATWTRQTDDSDFGGGPRRRPDFVVLAPARWSDAIGNAVAPIALAVAVLDISGSPPRRTTGRARRSMMGLGLVAVFVSLLALAVPAIRRLPARAWRGHESMGRHAMGRPGPSTSGQ